MQSVKLGAGLTDGQKAILTAVRDNSLIVWIGSIRSGKGVGAANALVQIALTRALALGRSSNFIAAGNTSSSFIRNNLDYLIDICEQAGLYARYKGGDERLLSIQTPDKSNELARVHIFGAGNVSSYRSLRGLTAHSAWIDEATLCHPDFVLTAIERCSFGDSRVILTSNADRPGHWLKTDYIDTKPPGMILLQSDFDENPHYSDERRDFMRSLNPNSAASKRSVGNLWVGDEGQIIPLGADHIDEQEYPLAGTAVLDAGTASITAALLFAPTQYGHCVVDEYYWQSDQQGRLTDKAHLTNLRTKKRWAIHNLVIDPAAASMKVQAREMGLPGINARNPFAEGVQAANNALAAGKVKINKRCVNLLSESQGYLWNQNETGPISGAVDHAMDCLRYGVLRLHPVRKSLVFGVDTSRR